MSRVSRKWAAVITVGTLAIGGSAFAYWSNSGSGPGTAGTGTNVPVSVNQTTTITGLAPGLPAQTLSGTFTNTNAGPVYVAAVTAVVASTDKGAACTATDYTIAGTALVGHEVAAGALVDAWTGLTIQFNDKGTTNQDLCKGAVVTLSYTSS